MTYDAGTTIQAARVYWLLRTFGHQNVSILNGGLKKWVAESRPTESTASAGAEADYSYTFNPDLYATFEQVIEIDNQSKDGNAQVTIVDSRND